MAEDAGVTLPLNPRVLMILLSFAEGPAHGYEVKKRAEHLLGDSLRLDAGSLYRSIAQLLERGLIEEVGGTPKAEARDSRRRYYKITARGRELAAAETRRLVGLVEYAAQLRLFQAPWVAR